MFGNYNQPSPLNRYDDGVVRYDKGYYNFMKDCLILILGTYGANRTPKRAYDDAKAILKQTKAIDGKKNTKKLLGFFKKAMKVSNQVGIKSMVAHAVKRSRQINEGVLGYDPTRTGNNYHLINAFDECDSEKTGDLLYEEPFGTTEVWGGRPSWDILSYSVQFNFNENRKVMNTRDNDLNKRVFGGNGLEELTLEDYMETYSWPKDFQILMTVYPSLEYKLWSDWTSDKIYENRQKLIRNASKQKITCYNLAETKMEVWDDYEGRRNRGFHYVIEIDAPTEIEGVPWTYSFHVNLEDNTLTWMIRYNGDIGYARKAFPRALEPLDNASKEMDDFMEILFNENDHKSVINSIPLVPLHKTKWETHEGVCQDSLERKYENVIQIFKDYGIKPPMYLLASKDDFGIVNHPLF